MVDIGSAKPIEINTIAARVRTGSFSLFTTRSSSHAEIEFLSDKRVSHVVSSGSFGSRMIHSRKASPDLNESLSVFLAERDAPRDGSMHL